MPTFRSDLKATKAPRRPPRAIRSQEDDDEDGPETCPDCGKKSVVPASGGGVVCKTKGCGYWFCY